MSPKQSFFTRPVLTVCLVLPVILFEGCADKIKTDVIAFKTLNESLTNSNNAINRENQIIIKSFEDRISQPATAGKATKWFPRAQQIKKYSDDMYVYVEGLRSELKKEAGLKANAKGESFRESDKPAVNRLFFKKEKGKDLYEHFKRYKQDVLLVDSLIFEEFEGTLLITPGSFKPDGANGQDFAKTFFDDIPAIAALTVLTAFQNNVRIAENRLLSFCHNQLTGYSIH